MPLSRIRYLVRGIIVANFASDFGLNKEEQICIPQ